MTDRDTGERPLPLYVVDAISEQLNLLRQNNGLFMTQHNLDAAILPTTMLAMCVGEVNTLAESKSDGLFLLTVQPSRSDTAPPSRQLYVFESGKATYFAMEPEYTEEQLLVIKKFGEAHETWLDSVNTLPAEIQPSQIARVDQIHTEIKNAIQQLQDLMDMRAKDEIDDDEFDARVAALSEDEDGEESDQEQDDATDTTDDHEWAHMKLVMALHEFEHVMTGIDHDMDCEVKEILDGEEPLDESTTKRVFSEKDAWALLNMIESTVAQHQKRSAQHISGQ